LEETWLDNAVSVEPYLLPNYRYAV